MADKSEERIALLEAGHRDTLRYRLEREAADNLHHKETREIVDEMREDIGSILDNLSSQRNFIAGVVFTITAVGFVINLFADRLFGNG